VKLLLKNALFTLLIPGTVGVYVPLILARGHSAILGLTLLVSLAFFGIASAIYVWSVWDFATRGRGTPLPFDAPKRLVIQGPYQYTRNPMYVALLAALLGWILLYLSIGLLLYTLAVAAAVSLFVIRYEEPHLQREFGADYDNYRARVPRWLPRLQRAPDA
jgi:protein-S-isoprenylcysteine O-methyltransferase Ste14